MSDPTETLLRYQTLLFEGLPNAEQYIFKDEGGSKQAHITGLSRINLFIGPNNTGKSRFLRALFSAEDYRFELSGDFSGESVFSRIQYLNSAIERLMEDGHIQSLGPIKRNPLGFLLERKVLDEKMLADLEKAVFALVNNQNTEVSYGSSRPTEQEVQQVNNAIKEAAKRVLSEFQPLFRWKRPSRRVYLPILRGLRPLQSEDLFQNRTLRDYFKNLPGTPETRTIFTGHGLYEELRKRLLGLPDARGSVAGYEKFLQQEVFDGKEVGVVPRYDGDTVDVKIGDDDQRPIFDLGDGVQTIIMLTYLPFISDESTLFFFEEPDLALHPGLQRRLLEILSTHERFRKHQFFITTHSNHLLDLTADYENISVFLFRKPVDSPRFSITLVANKDKSILLEIGARSSSVFLTNASIWVEGITDRFYLRAFLVKYLASRHGIPSLREDVHYSFITYGGSNIAHWTFDELNEGTGDTLKAARVCSQSFLILDGDQRKRKNLDQLQKQLGDSLFLLDCKEIENLLPSEIVRAVAQELVESSNLGRKPEKSDYEGIKEEEYQQEETGLGAYLDRVLRLDKGYFAAESGTLKPYLKAKFCQLAVAKMGSLSDCPLTKEAEELCHRVVRFILDSNGIRVEHGNHLPF